MGAKIQSAKYHTGGLFVEEFLSAESVVQYQGFWLFFIQGKQSKMEVS